MQPIYHFVQNCAVLCGIRAGLCGIEHNKKYIHIKYINHIYKKNVCQKITIYST